MTGIIYKIYCSNFTLIHPPITRFRPEIFEISPFNLLPLRWGRRKVAAGSESLWLGEGWTKGITPSPLPC